MSTCEFEVFDCSCEILNIADLTYHLAKCYIILFWNQKMGKRERKKKQYVINKAVVPIPNASIEDLLPLVRVANENREQRTGGTKSR